jgi:peptide chain release factor 3
VHALGSRLGNNMPEAGICPGTGHLSCNYAAVTRFRLLLGNLSGSRISRLLNCREAGSFQESPPRAQCCRAVKHAAFGEDLSRRTASLGEGGKAVYLTSLAPNSGRQIAQKMTSNDNSLVQREAARRRTFAIISHPDAGKTTLTEKFLLYGGRVEVAGAVRGRKSLRATTSDWMEIEKQRGISVSSTVLPFEYQGYHVNLLDTPGHHDFSEDTYRTLMATDCAVMVIDLAKGVEPQTQKLFRVCAMRQIPILTFVNKVDRPGLDPLSIISEIEAKLDIEPVPMNWPVGSGVDFRGLVDLVTDRAYLFDKSSGDLRVPWRIIALDNLANLDVRCEVTERASEEIELLRSAGGNFCPGRFLNGEATPVYFGSALKNYGIEHFLQAFLELCPSPGQRLSNQGLIPSSRSEFSGFVFKIQANLDPRHRDRVAFLRVCSGRFERDMEVLHTRTGKRVRLGRAHLVFGRERETIDEAFPGDIVGLINPGVFQLGDTLCEGPPLRYEPLPQFPPEHFAILRCPSSDRRKQFERGLNQLIEEGAIQVFTDPRASHRELILGAVGQLQFDVVRYRLQNEYLTETTIEWLPFKSARWIAAVPGDPMSPRLRLPYGARVVKDQYGGTAVLFQSQWDCDHFTRENPAARSMALRE